jgi:hypothetical protein
MFYLLSNERHLIRCNFVNCVNVYFSRYSNFPDVYFFDSCRNGYARTKTSRPGCFDFMLVVNV